MMLKPSCSSYTFFEAKISLELRICMGMKVIPCTDSWKAAIFYESTNFDFPMLVSLRQLHVFVVKEATIRRITLLKNMHPDSFEIPKTSSKTVYGTPCASRYSDAANCLSGDVGSGTKLVGVKISPSHKVLSRKLNAVRLMCIFSKNSAPLF